MERLTRGLVNLAAVGTMVFLASCLDKPGGPSQELIDNATIRTLHAQPTETAVIGLTPLGLDATRDGFLYVPANYDPSIATPLVVLLHGAGGSANDWNTPELLAVYDNLGIIVLAVDARESDWDSLVNGEYDADVQFIAAALEIAFRKCKTDPARLGIAGFASGGSEAIGIGITNSGLLRAIVAFAPGSIYVPFSRGIVDIFIAHGTEDVAYPFNLTANNTIPRLQNSGYPVQFVPFSGGHAIPVGIISQGLGFVVGH